MTGVFKKGHKEQKASEKERGRGASEGRQSVESLKDSEKRDLEMFRDVAACSFDSMYEVDAEWRCTYASPVIERVMGYTPQEVVGRHFFEFFHPEDRKRLKKTALAVLAEKKPFRDFIGRFVHKDGSEVWVSTSGIPKFDDQGNFRGYRGANTDITDRIKAERALRQSQERWQALMQSLPDVVVIVSRDGTILEVNEAAQNVLPGKVVIGTNAFEYVPPAQAGVMRKAFEHVFLRGKPYSYEIAGTGTAGEYASWYTTRLVPIEREGQVIAAVMISRDITDRKRAEEATKRALNEWQTTFDSSHDLMMLLNSQGEIIKANLATEKFLQKPRTEICGKKCYHLIHGTDAPPDFCPAEKARRTKEREEAEMYLQDRDMWFLVTIDPLLDEKGRYAGAVQVIKDITERKQAEEALRESEEKWRTLVQNIPDIIITVASDGTIVAINRTVIGVPIEEVIGRKVYDYIPPDQWDLMRSSLERVFRTGEKDTYEILGEGPRGPKTAWYETRAVPIKRDGKVVAATLISTDITERRRARQALQESEEKFRLAFENAKDAIFWADPETELITNCNKAAEVLLGRKREEIIGQPQSSLHPAEAKEHYTGAFRKHIRKGGGVDFEGEVITKSGKRTPVVITASFTVIGDKRIVQAIFHDITDRKQADKILRESEEKFRLAFENAKDAIFWADPETELIVNCNRAAEVLLERKRDQIIGQHQTAIHQPEKAEFYAKMFKDHIEKRGVVDNEAEVITKTGKIVPVHITASMTAVGGRPIMQGIFRDITFRKQAEEKLKAYSHNLEQMVEERTRELDRARARLFQSSKLAALGRMGAGIAHQLNSPICSGLLSVDSLAQDYKNVPKQQRLLQNLRNSLASMHDVVECMLAMSMVSRPGAPVRANVDLNGVLSRILELVGRECEKRHIKMESLLDPDLPPIQAAVGELDQVFINLVNNAIDAMEKGGKLSIHTIKLPEGIEVHIRDTGKGIPSKHLDQVFEPFFTTRLAEKGIGLGLSVAREIVERYGGEIGVVSHPGKGSTFSVRLPAMRAKEKQTGLPLQGPKQKSRH